MLFRSGGPALLRPAPASTWTPAHEPAPALGKPERERPRPRPGVPPGWRARRPQLGGSRVGDGQPSRAAVLGRGARCARRPEFGGGHLLLTAPEGGRISRPSGACHLSVQGRPPVSWASHPGPRALPEAGRAPQRARTPSHTFTHLHTPSHLHTQTFTHLHTHLHTQTHTFMLDRKSTRLNSSH